MANSISPDESWDELARELGLERVSPTDEGSLDEVRDEEAPPTQDPEEAPVERTLEQIGKVRVARQGARHVGGRRRIKASITRGRRIVCHGCRRRAGVIEGKLAGVGVRVTVVVRGMGVVRSRRAVAVRGAGRSLRCLSAFLSASRTVPLQLRQKLRRRHASRRHTGHRQKHTRVKITGIAVPNLQIVESSAT